MHYLNRYSNISTISTCTDEYCKYLQICSLRKVWILSDMRKIQEQAFLEPFAGSVLSLQLMHQNECPKYPYTGLEKVCRKTHYPNGNLVLPRHILRRSKR
ncbi:hypothetical protein CEXT_358491 [Caerostris extrusa]|uniref:Uncharacterized protein n=1 Tax=Caerostris extrusa TaxID=172846 RepID=A0AAV4TXH3_CAEEX|nr:hypothetical protein CEXT_358491 [Caerostris extrusa]